MNNKRRIILSPHPDKSKLWCWTVLEEDKKNNLWYCIDTGVEVSWDIAARRARQSMQVKDY